ncbi:hypothetical protein GWK47_051037 [Chionoecetes opilio]|uniref:Uncharacterized protein n=1 Tax=Chionoecetes opilio TaxID=41210 RepID=A0A8J5CTE0_CHIOP|nr:hypothetical protein GWK47_051037 [Chionoecetes opilio]
MGWCKGLAFGYKIGEACFGWPRPHRPEVSQRVSSNPASGLPLGRIGETSNAPLSDGPCGFLRRTVETSEDPVEFSPPNDMPQLKAQHWPS